ncbi:MULTISPECIES: EscU/YscU/HrcU family type III secretion system export apparatus switch protein [unclassified Mesorhizobium]|uniref:EscU/YscU/HrcU family type III secretion system export apparatus switch protein n=1 Tax=unclassified Mesorhizobium TaxID=325217 RepID=UPI000FC9E1DA|nr:MULTISPECIES: EscU/YscU/HrcU family type III secretion system export apparatus switch protein [unclassified Mesorhizobium]TGP20102.1 EscU/YscU/HrcU family type III secretion system export apparatus switch protein [Mesorhizobium sp. M1D.F.Ca.ET.231.01.1.1]TGP27474.1 EscU/YscU/HrcU family type III secretion system export apparatus switch protein [Mesorhizobium sp. M1D.F.Ca.ET.234.01.1.1]TGS41509.1 EscU/YscU/HrcU family type III secretion system export apparatus switch protein [Mesorhizobium sp.
MAEEAEEKKLPASDKKLRDARRKGKVPQSRDLTSGFTFLAALAYLYFFWPTLFERLSELVQTVTVPSGPFGDVSLRAIRHSLSLLMLATPPLVGIVVVLTAVFGMLGTFGPVFSFEPLKPQLDHINPAKGLEKILSLRNVIEFAKGVIKLVLLACLFAFVLITWLQPLFDAPGCGPSCLGPMIKAVLTPLGIAAGLAFVAIGVIDVPVQRWLFLRDMRMTTTEYKREHKDLEGDPLIRHEQQRQRREAVLQPAKLGVKNAVIVFVSGDLAVALRYVKGETPVPAVVGKGQGRIAHEIMAQARQSGIPVVVDAAVAGSLFERANTGTYIGEELFSPVVRHLVRHGLT